MTTLRIQSVALDREALTNELADSVCGGFVSFEGWVRNHNEGQGVVRLEYEVYTPIAVAEGERIIAEARERFEIESALCEHREGLLEIGDMAVWVGAAARHRAAAFDACRFIIDNVKVRLPIWKKEFYECGDSGWVNCERCAAHAHG